MLQILSHTPKWVFVLFIGLVAFGFMQSRSRRVGRVPAYLLPLGMIALSLSGVQSSFGLAALPIAFWAAGLAAVTWVGYRYFRDTGISFDPAKGSFFIPGSWAPLLVIMAIFFSKYAFAVMAALQVGLVRAAGFTMLLSFAYGGFSGYFAARALSLYACARKSGNLTRSMSLRDVA